MTRVKAKKIFKPQWKIIIFGAVLLIALGLGLLATYMAGWRVGRDETYSTALTSQATITQAKKDITDQYEAASIKTNCTDPTTNVPYDGAAYFAKYLKVNAYANRATIRACNTGGELLARINGKWMPTGVNLNLDTRANPVWSTACWANDILIPDTKVRPENSSIDNDNLRMCLALQQGKILRVQDL